MQYPPFLEELGKANNGHVIEQNESNQPVMLIYDECHIHLTVKRIKLHCKIIGILTSCVTGASTFITLQRFVTESRISMSSSQQSMNLQESE